VDDRKDNRVAWIPAKKDINNLLLVFIVF